jgi:four helix bundle protein
VEWNIAEGCGRSGRARLLQFLDVSLSSLNELEGQLSFARDKKILADDVHASLDQRVTVVRRTLIAFVRTLQRRIAEDEQQKRKKRDGP